MHHPNESLSSTLKNRFKKEQEKNKTQKELQQNLCSGRTTLKMSFQ